MNTTINRKHVLFRRMLKAAEASFCNKKQLQVYLSDAERELRASETTTEEVGEFFAMLYPEAFKLSCDYEYMGEFVRDGKYRAYFSPLTIVAENCKL